jgi:deoxyribonuclease IV
MSLNTRKSEIRVGVHTSIAGGVEKAAMRAMKIGCDTFQVFSANPRGWKTLDLTPEECQRFRDERAAWGLAPVAVHDNYLINLASADRVIQERSVKAFRGEIERARALGADYLIAHPGSAKGATTTNRAVRTFVEAMLRAAKGMQLNGLMILIENTAGQGSTLGRSFEEIAEIIASASTELPVGACIDTAHCFQAGYPIHTKTGLLGTVRTLDSTIGISKVRIIHANDSKTAFASHVDRHEHIGKGAIGMEAFRRIVRHPKLAAIPFICETPIDRPGDDKRNLRVLRKLAAGSELSQVARVKAATSDEDSAELCRESAVFGISD